jgi:2-polyprenyl-3-methyl-5-hydroxy-6-metoxy-1,4-benzoquinol methylase
MSPSTSYAASERLNAVLPARDVSALDAAGKALPQFAGENRAAVAPYGHQDLLSEIANTYDSVLVRSYCKARFLIININILHILALCLRGKRRVLDIGCGFGLFGCYFAALHPEISYCGYDQNAKRIEMAKKAAATLGLKNASFHYGDARKLSIEDQFDAIMMVDLMHHIDDESKQRLVEDCTRHLVDDGSLIIKDISTHSRLKTFFTWGLDVVMTRGFDMNYWSEANFHRLLSEYFTRIDTFPLSDWLPYPHIVYLCENRKPIQVEHR